MVRHLNTVIRTDIDTNRYTSIHGKTFKHCYTNRQPDTVRHINTVILTDRQTRLDIKHCYTNRQTDRHG